MSTPQPQRYTVKQDENGIIGLLPDPEGLFVQYGDYIDMEKVVDELSRKQQLIPAEIQWAKQSIVKLKDQVITLKKIIAALVSGTMEEIEEDY